MIVAIHHGNYLLFTFLRSLFIVHEWNRPEGSNMRSCRVCGRREELDVDDGVNLAAWHPVWEGYAGAHLGRRGTRDAATDARRTAMGGSAGLSGQNGTASGAGTANVLVQARSTKD
jgi:hypothetical protein